MIDERPSNDQLRDFLVGKVSAKEQSMIASYLEIHPEALDDIIESDISDSLLSDLQQPPKFFSSEPAFQEGLEKARLIPRQQAQVLVPSRVGSYFLLDQIDRKRASAVFKARDERTNQIIALKILPFERSHDPKIVDRFRREMELLEQLDHPNIVRFIEAGEANGVLYLTMELLQGSDLSRLVKKMGPLPIGLVCYVGQQAALALDHAFKRGFVHRDVKPSNIFLTKDGELKLLDLGLARPLTDESASITHSDQLLGTIDYMAPEQAFDSHKADIRSDIYSLGCTLYTLLVGVAPFSGPEFSHVLKKLLAHSTKEMVSIRKHRSDIPVQLAQVIERMCAKQPSDRFQIPFEVANVLAPFSDDRLLPDLVEKMNCEQEGWDEYSLEVEDESIGDQPVTFSGIKRSHFKTFIIRFKGTLTSFFLGVGVVMWFVMTSPTPKKESPAEKPARVKLKQMEKSIAPLPVVSTKVTLAPVFSETAQILQSSPYSGIWCINASNDGKYIRTGSNDGNIRIWNHETKKLIANLRKREDVDHSVHAFAFTADGKQCLSAGFPSYVVLWDIPEQKIVKEFVGHVDRVWTVCISPDEFNGASAGWDGTIRIWDMKSGEEVRVIEANIGKVLALAYSKDGKSLIAGGRSKVVQFDISTGQQQWGFDEQRVYVNALSVSSDGQFIVTGSRDNTVRVLHADTGQQVHVLTGNTDWVNAVAISDNGKWILSGCADGTVRLWDAATGEEIRCFKGHKGPVNSVSFVEKSLIAISGGDDRTIRFWPLPDGGEL